MPKAEKKLPKRKSLIDYQEKKHYRKIYLVTEKVFFRADFTLKMSHPRDSNSRPAIYETAALTN